MEGYELFLFLMIAIVLIIYMMSILIAIIMIAILSIRQWMNRHKIPKARKKITW
jgi:uncharacterized protein HemY